ncbi:hypothetical protein ACVBE9_09890 [Eionea flava]
MVCTLFDQKAWSRMGELKGVNFMCELGGAIKALIARRLFRAKAYHRSVDNWDNQADNRDKAGVGARWCFHYWTMRRHWR